LISRVRGRLVGLDVDRVEVETVAGVVYEVHVPLTVFNRLPAQGEDLELLTAYIVRDDTPSLYGFLETRERVLFSRLLTVQKVGPRLALAMMSAYRAGRLARAIAEQDAKVLIQVSGLGKKTAERIGLELKDRLPAGLAGEPDAGDAAPSGGDQGDVVSALLNLGYHRAAAERAAQAAVKSGADGFERTLRQALRELSK
jgi:Holliday junction DNA helicase RuvA